MRSFNLYKNSYYQGLIQDLFSGKDGCFVCFMQVFYQNNICKSFDKRIECLDRIVKKELKNCEILSGLLTKLGADAQYQSSERRFVSGKDVDYVKDLKMMLLADVELFEISTIQLKNAISKIEDLHIRANLKKILINKKESLEFLREEILKI